MLFNSYEYIFLFLPSVFFIYFYLNHQQYQLQAKLSLALASLFFYGWYFPMYFPIILFSILFNYAVGEIMQQTAKRHVMKRLLIFGVVGNLSLLGYYKYADFLILNLNAIFAYDIKPSNLTLPLAISFFTFQQIAFLADIYIKGVKEKYFLDYTLFVSFFPQLIMGPIVHHREMMPQFLSKDNKEINYDNIAPGLMQFSIGLFKKVVIADTLAGWSIAGFDQSASLNFFEAWLTAFSFGLQLYFDFSGYADMALGAGLLFNIKLPINFSSPWKVQNIQEFWMRWHITLTRFLKRYVYIPLSSRQQSKARRALNLVITFVVGGFWHGASWMFIIWGLLHGLAVIVYQIWIRIGFALPRVIAMLVTTMFNVSALVFFRSQDMTVAKKVLGGMYSGQIVFPGQGNWLSHINGTWELVFMIVGLLMVVYTTPNSMEIRERFPRNIGTAVYASLLFTVAIFNLDTIAEFIYFNF